MWVTNSNCDQIIFHTLEAISVEIKIMFYLVFVIFFLFLLLPEVVNVSNPKLIPTYDGWLRLFVPGVHLINLYMLKPITKKSSA